MVMKDIEFSVDGSDGRKIDMVYYVESRQLFIWVDRIQHPKPTVLDVDYMNMAKAKQDFCQVFNGNGSSNGNDGYVKSAWAKFSDLINPCMYQYYQTQKASGNGNGDGEDRGLTDEYTEALNRSRLKIPESQEDELKKAIPNRDYKGFIINTVKKEVKRDDDLIRQVLDTALSAYTFDPLNLMINSPTSEGKTYTTEKVMQYFPEEDVWSIGNMSDKALIRQRGILINSKGESIQEQVDKLQEEYRNINTATISVEPPEKVPKNVEGKPLSISERIKMKKAENLKKLSVLMEGASKMINFQGKILVFFEPPGKNALNLIKPILSHDKDEINYPYTAKDERSGQWETLNVIVRGAPAIIMCSAKDLSEWDTWPEIQSRFLITSTNMTEEKVHDANLLIGQRQGLPEAIKQKLIVSDKDQELAKKCVVYIKDWINRLTLVNDADYKHPNIVWIPYYEILANALPHYKGTDNRATKRIFSFLNIAALTNVHHRSNLIYGNAFLPIATLEDLDEVLHINQKNMSGIPSYKIDFYTNYFIPLYESKIAPDINTKNGKEEDIIAVTTSQLCEYFKAQTGKPITSDSVRKTYLYELINNGYVDYQDSKIDGHQKIYFPIMEMPIKSQDKNEQNLKESTDSRSFLQHSMLIPSKSFKKIPENWLELAISVVKMSGNENDIAIQIMDKDDNEISIDEFIANYQNKDMNLFLLIKEPKI